MLRAWPGRVPAIVSLVLVERRDAIDGGGSAWKFVETGVPEDLLGSYVDRDRARKTMRKFRRIVYCLRFTLFYKTPLSLV